MFEVTILHIVLSIRVTLTMLRCCKCLRLRQKVYKFDIPTEGGKADDQDWATMVEEEEWKSQHDKARLDKNDVQIDDVLVATCGQDGFVRIWRPLQVKEIQFVVSLQKILVYRYIVDVIDQVIRKQELILQCSYIGYYTLLFSRTSWRV